MERKYGGNVVRQLELNRFGRQNFVSGSYTYYCYKTQAEEMVVFDGLASFAVFVLGSDGRSECLVQENNSYVKAGDVVLVENSPLSLKIRNGSLTLLVAGTIGSPYESTKCQITPFEKIYKVNKPWGHELWINGEHPAYCLKQIFIKAGNRTSLQYHQFKQETNVLFEGEAKLHYKINPQITNDEVQEENIAAVSLLPVSAIDISPPILHRLEASSDILLYEVSTPHLDDVIRVQDDSKRPDGRIHTEHRN